LKEHAMTKRLMLLCGSLASVIVLVGLSLVVGQLSKTRFPATPICLFTCVPGPIAPIAPTTNCFYRCVVTPTPALPPPDSPIADPPAATALPDWLLIGGWVLPTLLALLLGVRHGVVQRPFRWMVLALLLALLLEIGLLAYILSPLSQQRFAQEQALAVLLACVATMVLVPVVCLLYARTMDPQE
jgi:hypothetical protein